jgi:hypothetical protein
MNVFLDLADRQIAAPRKARLSPEVFSKGGRRLRPGFDQRSAERLATARKESAVLRRAWRAWQRKRVEELMAGPYGEAARELRGFLADMTMGDAAALVAAVENGPWRQADADVRFEVLRLVDHAIVRLRETNSLPPFDDALPGEPPTAFEIIREALR